MNHIPSLQANYTPVPNSFLQLAFSGKTSREEVITLLLFFSKTYGWKPEKGFISTEDLVNEAGLSHEEATRGLALAIDHDQVLEMPLDPKNPGGRSMYLLNTLENRRFLEAYASASFDLASPSAPAPVESAAPARAPAAPGVQARGARPRVELSPLESGDMEAPPELPPIDDELEPVRAAPAGLEPLPAPASAPPRGPAGLQPAVQAGGSPVPTSAPGRPAAAGGVSAPPAPPAGSLGKPLADWGYQQKTIDMVIRLLGRVPSKDERARLAALGASDAELIDAMGRLLEKKVSVYSSDLIVYEYEALKSAERRTQRTQDRKQEREDKIKRQKDCRRCDGLGYFFVGVSGIQECDCRK